MFFGAIVSGLVDADYVLKIRKETIQTANCQLLHEAIHDLYLKNGWADYLSIQDYIAPKIGTAEAKKYLDDVVAKVPQEFNPAKAVELIEESHVKKASLNFLKQAEMAIQSNPLSSPEILYSVYEKMEGLLEHKSEFSLSEEFGQTVTELVEGNTQHVIIPTGIKKIDHLIGGFSTGEITLIGGRPGHGKTTVSVALARQLLDTNPDLIVVKFELEMGKAAIKRKFLSNVSRVSSYKMRINQLDASDHEKLKASSEKMQSYEGRLFIYDNIYDLVSMNKIARSLKANVVMVDFITLMDDADESNLRLSLGRVAKIAKRFAKAHNMSYIFFSQLSRQAEMREGNRPQSSDISESDILTQLASDIILLYYKFKYSFDERDRHSLYVIFDKARYSQIGDIKLYFDPDVVMLTD